MDEGIGFKFTIGAWLQHKATSLPWPKLRKDHPQPMGQPLLVIERLQQECIGGVQRFYTVRPCQLTTAGFLDAAVGFTAELYKLNEIELEEWTARPDAIA